MAAHLLAIDDSLTIRKLLELALTTAGFELELAGDARSGLAAIARSHPQLLLLDYVLPDRKGVEVCAELCAKSETQHIPVIVMSARSDGISQLFAPYPNVVAFMPKPFTPAAIVHAVKLALGKNAPHAATERVVNGTTPATDTHIRQRRAQAQIAAKQLYGILRDGLSRVPSWFDGLDGQAPAPYFASRLLTPEIMERLLQALRAPAELRTVLGGSTRMASLPRLFELIESSCSTGELWLGDEGAAATVAFCSMGEVLLVSSTEPERYLQGHDLDDATQSVVNQAVSLQRSTAKPVPVSLHEQGLIDLPDPPTFLRQLGLRAAVRCMDGEPVRFTWHERATAEPWLTRYGSRLTAEMLTLSRLRQVDDWTQIEAQVPSLRTVFVRAPGFQRLLSRLELESQEHAVLVILDGRCDVSQVIERTRLSTFDAFNILHRLARLGVIMVRTAHSGQVLLVEPDQDGVAAPLSAWLGARGLQVQTLQSLDQALPGILESKPCVAIVAGGQGSDLSDLSNWARSVRSHLEIAAITLVALLPPQGSESGLRAAGFDAVLHKPFALADLAQLLAA
jgi:DNA-binding response OmpR family regulator